VIALVRKVAGAITRAARSLEDIHDVHTVIV
jgi:hypothetical protein